MIRPFYLASLLLLQTGCVEGVPIEHWTLESEGLAAPRLIEMPGNLLAVLPLRELSYVLRAELPLNPNQRGTRLTLALDCFHGPLVASIDGTILEDAGDSGAGEHRYLIPGELTGNATLPITLSIHHDSITSAGFGVVPRLIDGWAMRGPIGRINRAVGEVELGVILGFVLLFGGLYLLDRRYPENGAFVVAELVGAVLPLWQIGALYALTGALTTIFIGVQDSVLYVAVMVFTHLGLKLGPVPRWVFAGFAFTAVMNLVGIFSLAVAISSFVLMTVMNTLAVGYLMVRAVRIARDPQRRTDTRIFIGSMAITLVVVIGDFPWLLFGHSAFGGVHTASIGVFMLTLSAAFFLARQHVGRQTALEASATELRRQVAERSKELAAALSQLSVEQQRPLEPDRIIDGRYRVLRKLGAGGMGAVYEVERLSDHRRFALKTIKGRADPALMSRFAREAQIAAELLHPNLVPVLDVGLSQGALFLLMPLVDGGSLEASRARFGDLAWARPLLKQVAAGLVALHQRRIVHRDLKPANILIAGGIAQIADFGLASLGDGPVPVAAADGFASTAAPALPLTRAGELFGTPAYMAPELAHGVRAAHPSSDVFSFGLIAYELAAGRAAFAEPPVISRIAGRAIALPAMAAIDPSIREAIRACLDLNPALRPTALELPDRF